MKYSVEHVFFCAIVLCQFADFVKSESTPPYSLNSDTKLAANQQPQHQQQQHLHHHPRMSCYVCSTMDYESSTDNICRTLKSHDRSPNYQLNSHPQSNAGHLHFAHMSASPTTQTTTTTTTFTTEPSNQYDQSSLPSAGALVASSPGDRSYQDTTTTSNYHTKNGQYDDTTSVNTTSLARMETSTAATTPVSSSYNQRRVVPSRTVMHNNDIRTRQCMEDENFCSIVSVVRIEFVQENFYPKFWALERNCSKSCNTGCMTIGERVRLRVCSQCCRTANCNFGSGTLSTKSFNIYCLTSTIIIGLLMIAHWTRTNSYLIKSRAQ